jgi:hypothetical protein
MIKSATNLHNTHSCGLLKIFSMPGSEDMSELEVFEGVGEKVWDSGVEECLDSFGHLCKFV